MAENVRAYLDIGRLAGRPDNQEIVVRLLHRKAADNIRSALRPLGFYSVTVASDLSRQDGIWRASYSIEPGPRVSFEDVAVELQGPGAADPALVALIEERKPAKGEPLRHDRYEGLKNSLLSLAAERGYFDARFLRNRLAINPEELTADVELLLETGGRYRFGTILVEQDALDAALIQRYLTFSEGQPFDSEKLLDLQYALYDSEYFSFVEVSNGQPDREAGTVPVSLRASAGKRQRYRFSIGYGTDTEARIGLGWENRRVNRRGHKLRFDGRLSSIRHELSTRYLIPLAAPARERLTFNASALEETLADTRSRRIELGVTRSTVRAHWERDLYLRAIREETREAGVSDFETLLLPGVIWLRSKSDNLVYPRRGSRLSAELRGSHTMLGSDLNFLQLELQARLIVPVAKRARLIARSDLGATSIDENDKLPASFRFFAGGDNSVRGFGLNSLGPTDDDGGVIGGRYLFSGSLEFEQLLTERWGYAIFVDAGNAFQDFDAGLEYSAGLGLRWLSPVGMFRLDIAKPLNKSGESPRLHLSVGGEL